MLEQDAASLLDKEGISTSDRTTTYQLDLRYSGQGFEVPIEVSLEDLDKHGFEAAEKAFEKIHEQLFTFTLDLPHELVNLRAIVQQKEQDIVMEKLSEGAKDPSDALIKNGSNFWYDSETHEANI